MPAAAASADELRDAGMACCATGGDAAAQTGVVQTGVASDSAGAAKPARSRSASAAGGSGRACR